MRTIGITRAEMILHGLALFSVGCLIVTFFSGDLLAGDWLAYWSAGKVILSGVPERLYDLEYFREMQSPYIEGVCPFLYAPGFALPFVPLALVPMETARVLWFLLHLVSLGAVVHFSKRWTGLGSFRSGVFLFAFTPVIFALYLGQVTPILLLATVLVVKDQFEDAESITTGLIAGVLLLKPQLLLICFFYWLLGRKWRPLAGLGLSGGILLFASILVHPGSLEDFFRARVELGPLVFQNVVERGINPTVYTEIGATGAVLLGALILTALAASWKVGVGRHFLALLWIAPILTTPYLGTYDLALLAVPASLVLPVADRRVKIALGFCWLAPFVSLLLGGTYHKVIWAVLLLFLAIFSEGWRPGKVRAGDAVVWAR